MELLQTVNVSAEDSRFVRTEDGKLYAVVAMYDQGFSENPLDWDPGNNIFYVTRADRNIDSNYWHRELGTEDELVEAWDQGLLKAGWDDEHLEEELIMHYTRQGFTAERVTLRGYSQSDWVTGVYAYKDYSVLDTLQDFFAGNVYIVGSIEVEDEDSPVFLGDIEDWLGGVIGEDPIGAYVDGGYM